MVSIAAFWENNKTVRGYILQSNRLSKLSKKHWETKQELKQTKHKLLVLQNAGKQLLDKCKEITKQCDDIITNKKNCGWSADYLRRNSL